MTLTPVGFKGSVNAVQDAFRSRFQGVQLPVVGSSTAMEVKANGAATLTCTIEPGVAWAHGVMVTSDAVSTVTFDPVAVSGQTRWDAVVLRRTWTDEGGTVAFTVVKGTAAAAATNPQLAPPVNDTPGTVHDHVLALVLVTYNVSVPTAVSRRLWASKSITAPAYAALPPASALLFGADVTLIDGSRYRCLLDGSNNPAWIAQGGSRVREMTSGLFVPPIPDGWGIADLSCKALVDDFTGDVQLDLQFRRSGSPIVANTNHGDFPDTTVAQLVPALAPTQGVVPATWQYAIATGVPAYSCQVVIDTTGIISLRQGSPGVDLATRAAGIVSLRGSVGYKRKVA